MNSMTDITGEDFFEGRTENPPDVCSDCGEDPCICLDDKPGEKQDN